MTWPIPAPADIAEAGAAVLQSTFPDADPRAPESVMAALCRILGLTLYDAYLFALSRAQELMPDTAVEWLERHADIWGVTRLPAVAAGGPVTFAGAAGTAIPAGTELRANDGAAFTTQALAMIGGGGTATVQILAVAAGAAGSLAAGTQVPLVSPIAGLSVQSATVAAGGLASPAGRDRETDEGLRDRLLRRIRTPPRGGAAADYEAWAREVPGVERVRVESSWVGAGSVGVIVAMAGGTVPSGGDLDAVAAAIETRRPVTATVVVAPIELVAINVSIGITPDTAAIRAAVAAALDLFFARADIGAPLYATRLSEAVSAAAGEYAHEVVGLPAVTVLAPQQMPVLGTLTFVAGWP